MNKQTTKPKTTAKRARVVKQRLSNICPPAKMSITDWQILLRQEQARKEDLIVREENSKNPCGEYTVSNPTSKRIYKTVMHGPDSEWNFCSCMDYKTSQLGTCKHLEAVKMWVKEKHKKICSTLPAYSSVYVDYHGPRSIKIRIGENSRDKMQALALKYFTLNGELRKSAYSHFDKFLQEARALDQGFRCYDDALDYIIEQREVKLRQKIMEHKYPDQALDSLLSVKLYPYQKEGVRFAVERGKSIIADEMGLGKTIQAIASAEIFMREGLAQSVLIVCPTSLKYQWKREIEKFTGASQTEGVEEYVEDGRVCPKVVVIEGNPLRRAQMYNYRAPYKIVSYHAMSNDIREGKDIHADILVMDEIQRLKNWDTQIARSARRIRSRYSVLLSGTPLENKLEELFSTMELADQYCFGPYYKFRQQHIIIDNESGRVLGYQNLNSAGKTAAERMLRRTKAGVRLQLPSRTDETMIIPMTEQQRDVHQEFKGELAKILMKYKRLHFMSEHDRRRMMLLLGQMRMVADSTFILEQNLSTRADVKIGEVMNILESVFENGEEKVVIFSEWERMTRLVAMELDKLNIQYEYLSGSVPSKERGALVERFTTLPQSRVFLSTDAGSTGLNLQVATILINLDLPWNPAVLEQRIARIHRLGQTNPVQIINLVSRDSIEEGMIGKLRFKSQMIEGVLDGGEDTVFTDQNKLSKFIDQLSEVMESTPDADTQVEYVDEGCIEQQESIAENESDSLSYSQPQEEAAEEKLVVAAGTGESALPAQPASPETEKPENSSSAEANQKGPMQTHELVQQGMSFLSGLSETLRSEQKTRQLVDSIVDVDAATGKTCLKIPVESKQTVTNVLQLIAKIFSAN